MRLLVDAILGALAFISIAFSWFSSKGWMDVVVYAVIAIVLVGLILLLHLKPHDNAEKLIAVTELQSINSFNKQSDH
jgi:amino acid permease